ncbi:hypothetical protein [Novosphingobium sp. Gsoil 351]|uniref:hypothetical protein n=1 Tax=Novosphingobium sp. Gsoil 351 TaxID=2675225 RepID=UPI0012B4A621|nr:hypothetical protein [Novosphingobium sp. Gsoil 351]QGN53913.1 hypothetical protein GKE62_04545 [Novosphingobium sp. Gsoil 351]
MNNPAFSPTEQFGVEGLFGDELAAADLALANVGPILRHLLGSEDRALFSDRIVAQSRALIEDLAHQLALALEQALGPADARGRVDETASRLAAAFIANPPILTHAHALALEAELTERLAARLSLDTVLSPLLQASIASTDPETAATAKALLAAQARFVQAQRRGELPLAELPGELLHAAMAIMRELDAGSDPARDRIAGVLETAICGNFDEAASRLALLGRLIRAMDGGAVAALDVEHAGVALFVTALGLTAGLERDAAVFATSEVQMPRLALALLAGGAEHALVERQFFTLHPEITLPEGFETLRADRAAALLAGSGG